MAYLRESVNKSLNMTQKIFFVCPYSMLCYGKEGQKGTWKFHKHNELFQIVLRNSNRDIN